MRSLPRLVCKLCANYEAWIVGSAADPENPKPRDYDVQVPFSTWGAAAQLIPQDATVNSFGGFKVNEDGIEIDVWPGELGWIMRQEMSKWAWQPSSGIRLFKSNEELRSRAK